MTLDKFYKSGIKFLEKKGIKDAKDDTLQILLNAFDLPLAKFLQIKDMNMITLDNNIKKWDLKINKYNEMLVKRVKHMPLQYILHEAYFYNIKFYVDENVLIPRQDTEILVSNVINDFKFLNNNNLSLLDMCTGSGAIGISIAKNLVIKNLTLSDISDSALEVTKKNIKINNISNENVLILKSDMFTNVNDFMIKNNINKFDIITINPPYIETDVIKTLDEEVKNYEPILALDGGADGLKFYKVVFDNVKNFLTENGKVYLEIGYNQAKSIKELFDKYDYKNFQIIKDLSNNDRVVKFTK